MRLSFIEMVALIFTALAGVAASIQAYVSWVARGEVARAIIFSERIDACSDMLAAINFVTHKATPEARKAVAEGVRENHYYPEYFLGYDAVKTDMHAVHRPLVARFQSAAAAFRIVMPEDLEPTTAYFERLILEEVVTGGSHPKTDLVAYLEEVDRNTETIVGACRDL